MTWAWLANNLVLFHYRDMELITMWYISISFIETSAVNTHTPSKEATTLAAAILHNATDQRTGPSGTVGSLYSSSLLRAWSSIATKPTL